MDSIWTGVVAGAVTAVAAVTVQLLTQRDQRRRLTAELEQRARATLQQLKHQTTLLTQELEHRTEAALRELEHQRNLQTKELEHQTRAALRQTYDKLLVTQRRSREASLRLATRTCGADQSADEALTAANDAHTALIEHYHQLNLDANREMWLEARGLRDVLDDLLDAAKEGNAEEAKVLGDLARDARQNLERSFRTRLGHEALQKRNPLGKYDKS